jgi:hypothetical protein
MIEEIKEILYDLNLALNRAVVKNHIIAYCECEFCRDYKNIKNKIECLSTEKDIVIYYDSEK